MVGFQTLANLPHNPPSLVEAFSTFTCPGCKKKNSFLVLPAGGLAHLRTACGDVTRVESPARSLSRVLRASRGRHG